MNVLFCLIRAVADVRPCRESIMVAASMIWGAGL